MLYRSRTSNPNSLPASYQFVSQERKKVYGGENEWVYPFFLLSKNSFKPSYAMLESSRSPRESWRKKRKKTNKSPIATSHTSYIRKSLNFAAQKKKTSPFPKKSDSTMNTPTSHIGGFIYFKKRKKKFAEMISNLYPSPPSQSKFHLLWQKGKKDCTYMLNCFLPTNSNLVRLGRSFFVNTSISRLEFGALETLHTK